MLCSHPLIDGGLVIDKQAGKFLSANCVWSKMADSAQSVVKYSALSAAWNTFAFPVNTKHEFIDRKQELELMDVAKSLPNLD